MITLFMEPGANSETRQQQLQRLEETERGVAQEARDAELFLGVDKAIQQKQREVSDELADHATAFEHMADNDPEADNTVIAAEASESRQDSEVFNAAANAQEIAIQGGEQRLQGAQEKLQAIQELRNSVIDDMAEDETIQ